LRESRHDVAEYPRFRRQTVNFISVRVEVQLKSYAERIDARMAGLLPAIHLDPSPLFEAMRYASLGPGKRLRPALCLAACAAVGGGEEVALNAACSLEMVHAFSLVHDDLPCIDNDDLRRGRPTCHKVFGEAVAILAGDALFAHAFQMLVTPAVGEAPPPAIAVRLVAELARAVGVEGVVAGETADILAEGKPVDVATLEAIHVRKTGILIAASARMGAIAGGGEEAAIEALGRYGNLVGLAFQIADDVLNETGTAEQLGKAAGSDRARGKATYPALIGLEASRERALALADEGIGCLAGLPGDTEFLQDLARFSVERLR